MQTAFLEYTKKDNTKVKYYDLIIPQGISTTYWLASRCVSASSGCNFRVRNVYTGDVSADRMCNNSTSSYDDSLALFTVISLSSKLIKSGETAGSFTVNLQ